ncbi:MAG: trypsin-like peptidase domain-containing protein [Planctomycetota bacterium]
MKAVRGLKTPILLALVIVFLLCPNTVTWAVSESDTSKIDPDAFVYILNMGIEGNKLHFDGLRNGFAVGDGQYILTAAHCVDDFESTNQVLRQPMVISPYYGDIFEAEIVAVDDVNDIAILKPTWDTHPALELETSDDWKKSETITITGYPPIDKKRGGNGGTYSRKIQFEKVPLVSSNGDAEQAIRMGPVKYVGEGWSGSALLAPETGRVVGITCIKNPITKSLRVFGVLNIPFSKKSYIAGCDLMAINFLFGKHHLTYGTAKTSFTDLNHRHSFEQILSTLDTFKPHSEKQIAPSIQKLRHELPDSYMACFMTGAAFKEPNEAFSFEKTVEMAPESSFVHAAYGNYLLSRNKPKKAVEQFQIVTERDPNHIFACYGLLSALVKTDPNAAETLGQELTKRWPENAGFCFEYSKALRAKNRRKEELPVIEKAIELCDEGEVPFQYWRYLADSLKANQQYEASEQAYKKLLKMHECEHCWWAYTLLLLDMGPDKIKQAKKARDKTMTFIHDPNQASEKQRICEAAIEKMLSDPNETSDLDY